MHEVAGSRSVGALMVEFQYEYRVPGNLQNPQFTYKFLKRTIDVGLSLILLLLLLPLLIFILIGIGIADGAPVFFRHERIGRGGAPFSCMKFRTMRRNADALLAQHLAASADARREWADTVKLKSDPRIIPFVGTFLRTTSLDELPQLINVLKGEMSLVGPRPVPAAELARYSDAASAYLSVQPGLTGLWQVSGRNNTTYARRIELDREYVRRRSVLFDLHILTRTLFVVLTRDGAS
jgi:lipopolysaccharide/colanic/teichoic acid biosynthesis glycosyltransferase